MKCRPFRALAARALAVAAVAAGVLALPEHAGAAVSVWFVADGKPVGVQRSGTSIEAAVRKLLAGPTAYETARGIHTAVPRNTPLRSLVVRHRLVTIDLGERF